MGVFKKKTDPVSDRAKALNAQIAALEVQIKQLDTELQNRSGHPRLRSTTLPGGQRTVLPAGARVPAVEPVFDHATLPGPSAAIETETALPRYNDLGVRRYDLPAALERLQRYLSGPVARNPKLVSYLAAGSIKGLRPLRYERRVERNRLILVFLLLVLMLWGITAMIL